MTVLSYNQLPRLYSSLSYTAPLAGEWQPQVVSSPPLLSQPLRERRDQGHSKPLVFGSGRTNYVKTAAGQKVLAVTLKGC